MENQVIVLPPIQICLYKGQKVISTTQIAALCKCSRQNITDVFRRHKEDFQIGVDYFFLEKDELHKFKVENGIFEEDGAGSKIGDNPGLLRPISKTASSTNVWTQSGLLKQATFFNTNSIKKFLRSAIPVIFGNDTAAPQNISPQIPAQTANTFSDEPAPNDLEKVRLLIKLAEMTDDKNLRDRLIKSAAEILLP